MKWVDALKVYNTGKSWCVPRKGSPEHAEVMKIMGKSKVESPAAPVAAAKMSVSKAEAVKQIKAHKEKEGKVSSMAAKVKERKAMRLLKALVVARRAKKAAAVSPNDIFTSLWEGEPSEKNSIRFKSAASNADIIKAIRDHNASYQSYGFTISTSSNGSRLITPSARSYQAERAFQTTFNRKAWVAYDDADGDKYSAAEIDKFKPTPAPLAPPKTKEELFHIIGAYVKTLTPGDYMTNSSFRDARRSYSINREPMPENVKKAFDAVRGLKVVYQTIGVHGANYHIQPTSNELEISVETQDNWAREYVYRDAFDSIGYTLSDRNEYLPEQIKEIYKGAYKKYQSRSEEASAPAPAPAPAPASKQIPLVKNLTDAENNYLIKFMKSTPTDAVMVLSGNLSDSSPSTIKVYKKFYGKVELPLPFDRTYIYHDKSKKQLIAQKNSGYHG